MTFLEALNSGKTVRSQYWDDDSINTIVFRDNIETLVLNIIKQTTKPITWKELLGEWYEV